MELVVVAHNIRSAHNIGSIFRTCDGFGVRRLYITGYSPYPKIADDPRLPFIAEKVTKQIHKTALGAETTVPFTASDTVEPILEKLKQEGFVIVGLEQAASAIKLPEFRPSSKTALVLGEEVHGISPSMQQLCDVFVEIPMYGKKESFNVSVAAGIALYALSQQPQ